MDAEDDLVRRSLSGDHSAFARLVEMHQDAALRVAVAMVGSGGDADDVVQDAFVKAFTRLDQFDHSRRFPAWLMGIVANEARNRRRADGRRTALTRRLAVRVDSVADAVIDPARAQEGSELRQHLALAVAALPDRDRDVIALRYFAELTEAEAADSLRCPIGTVKSRTNRALLRLRGTLSENVRQAFGEEHRS